MRKYIPQRISQNGNTAYRCGNSATSCTGNHPHGLFAPMHFNELQTAHWASHHCLLIKPRPATDTSYVPYVSAAPT